VPGVTIQDRRSSLLGMRYTQVGGTPLSVIGLGTWQFGSRAWRYGDGYAQREAVAITRRALDLGINIVDTAEIYGLGRSERIVGGAIADRRDEVFVATKLYPALPVPPVVRRRARASARRLGVDRLDLYQLHAPNPLVPLSVTMRGFADLQRDGLVARVGVSNCGLGEWQAAESALGGPVFANQIRYSLAARAPEMEILPWAQAAGRLVIAYSPLAQGLLSGAYDGRNTPDDVRRRNPLFLPENVERAGELLDCLREVARRHGATPAQVALAWLVRRPNVVAIPGASTVAQVEANAAAADLPLSNEDDRQLTEASDRFRPVGGKGAVRRHRARAFFRRRPRRSRPGA
jgi:aryl-alcohol dehydrogenase-like predicted oxidoreductase